MMRESMFEFRREVFSVGAYGAALLVLTGCPVSESPLTTIKNGDVLQNRRLRNN